VQRILDAKAVCESFDLPALPAVIFTRNVYDDAEEAGLSVFESDDEKARAEIDQICAAVLEIGQSFFSNENP
jgi:chromosome partitioning protein